MVVSWCGISPERRLKGLDDRALLPSHVPGLGWDLDSLASRQAGLLAWEEHHEGRLEPSD